MDFASYTPFFAPIFPAADTSQQGSAPDPRDYTDRYNTWLTPAQEEKFQKDYPNNKDLYDYDLRGAYLANNLQPLPPGHMPDTYKKPNHITFSDQSQYNGAEGRFGGQWQKQENGSWTFSPGQGNMYSRDELADYFKREEPNNTLIPPRIVPFSDFRKSDNIDDRRDQPPYQPPAPDNSAWGRLTGNLASGYNNRAMDLQALYQSYFNPMSRQLGINDIGSNY